MKENNKVLVLVDNLEKGGVYQAVRNFYELFNGEIVFDFMTYVPPKDDFMNQIVRSGGKVYIIERVTNVLPHKYINQISKIIKDNGPYIAVHLHTGVLIWLAAIAAKKNKVKNIIGHAHGSQWKDHNIIARMIEVISRPLNRKFCTNLFACSDPSGRYNFGSGYTFLPNVITINEDIINIDNSVLENKYKKNNIVLGYLGMISETKNTMFILNIAEFCKKKEIDDVVFLIAGDGPMFKDVLTYKQSAFLDNVIMLGYRNDSYELLKTYDVLLVPSQSEGMSLSVLESQLIGTPVICSSGVPATNDLGAGMCSFINDYDCSHWLNECFEVMKNKTSFSMKDIESILIKINYDKNTVKRKLYNAYTN